MKISREEPAFLLSAGYSPIDNETRSHWNTHIYHGIGKIGGWRTKNRIRFVADTPLFYHGNSGLNRLYDERQVPASAASITNSVASPEDGWLVREILREVIDKDRRGVANPRWGLYEFVIRDGEIGFYLAPDHMQDYNVARIWFPIEQLSPDIMNFVLAPARRFGEEETLIQFLYEKDDIQKELKVKISTFRGCILLEQRTIRYSLKNDQNGVLRLDQSKPKVELLRLDPL